MCQNHLKLITTTWISKIARMIGSAKKICCHSTYYHFFGITKMPLELLPLMMKPSSLLGPNNWIHN